MHIKFVGVFSLVVIPTKEYKYYLLILFDFQIVEVLANACD